MSSFSFLQNIFLCFSPLKTKIFQAIFVGGPLVREELPGVVWVTARSILMLKANIQETG